MEDNWLYVDLSLWKEKDLLFSKSMFDKSIVKQTSTEYLVAWKEESWILIQEINTRDVQSTLFIEKKKKKKRW